jgi:hypothetical protein
MEKKYKTMYMHTIRGRPAEYIKGEQIVYGSSNFKIPDCLCKSLYQLRKEQILSTEWRIKKGFSSSIEDYSYVRIWIKDSHNKDTNKED